MNKAQTEEIDKKLKLWKEEHGLEFSIEELVEYAGRQKKRETYEFLAVAPANYRDELLHELQRGLKDKKLRSSLRRNRK